MSSNNSNDTMKLKDFQEDTVTHVVEMLQSKNSHNRVLVADEVGLGKTIIARGVINKLFNEEKNKDKPYKVIYICSNQVIARQNMEKLDVSHSWNDNADECRLSMQSLLLLEDESENDYIGKVQLIPLTPSTSFAENGWATGIKEERAYIYSVLSILGLSNNDIFKSLQVGAGKDNWKQLTTTRSDWKRIINNRYYDYSYVKRTKLLESKIKKVFTPYKSRIKKIIDRNTKLDSNQIKDLRNIFTEVSLDLLEPNLIILDEFQNFKSLLDRTLKDDSELSDLDTLVKKFFGADSAKHNKILMLSATPYKMYSTNQDVQEGEASHKIQFDSIIDFLFDKKTEVFKEKWSSYSNQLFKIQDGKVKELITSVKDVGDIMFTVISRTERMAAMKSSDIIQTISPELQLSKNDIIPFIQFNNVLRKLETHKRPFVDFHKSSPFLLSYMQNYKLKQTINENANNENFPLLNSQNQLWIDKKKIDNYLYDDPTYIIDKNAKLKTFVNLLFEENEINPSTFLWMPASKPYYKMEGAYKNCNLDTYKSNPFSKYLIFSAWELVPRMISTLISFIAEAKLHHNMLYTNQKTKETQLRKYTNPDKPKYFIFKSLTIDNRKTYFRYYIYTMIYPSLYLKNKFRPSKDFLNCDLQTIRTQISESIRNDLIKEGFKISATGNSGVEAYTLVPMYFDLKNGNHYQKWYKQINDYQIKEKKVKDQEVLNFKNQITFVNEEAIKQIKKTELPKDICNVLADAVLGSPAICLFRLFDDDSVLANITELAYEYCKYFDAPENVAAVNEIYCPKENVEEDYEDKAEKDNTRKIYWKNVLKYAADGCFQAVLDEYYDIIDTTDVKKAIKKFYKSINLYNASYDVETYKGFCQTMNGEDDTDTFMMRTHFAVCFTKGRDDQTGVNRKDSVRNAFNSPFKPFVLATTSIGQEGLDFHKYCRKIVHWNLPSNAIDIEQREGRVNRYKGLVIRQNLSSITNYDFNNCEEKQLWSNLYEQLPQRKELSQLYPYWCLAEKQKIKIERIILDYPNSRDKENYDKLMEILYNYRLTLGQPNQEELSMYLNQYFPEGIPNDLFINLSPYFRGETCTNK